MSNALVCGFGDPAAGIGALAWDLGEPGALLLSEGELRQATFSLEEGGDAATLQIQAGDSAVEATLSPRTAELPLGETGLTVVVCVADVIAKDGGSTVQCEGQISRWAGDPLEGSGTFRHLAIDAGDQSLVVIESRGEPDADHGDEQSSAWQIRGEEEAHFEDTFISTQYGASGDPTRLGLELWPEEAERASRAAATRVAAASLGGVNAGDAWAGLFRCQTDGVLGMGSYLLWRA
ncbi:MAG TPA: hypothetical protein VH501_00645 [Solirubrobacterales bacterium]|jgi:hypothetical protein